MNTSDLTYTTTNREGEVVEYSVPVIRQHHRERVNPYFEFSKKVRAAKSSAETQALLQRYLAENANANSDLISKCKRAVENRLKDFKK